MKMIARVPISELPENHRETITQLYPGAEELVVVSERPLLFRVRVGDFLLMPIRIPAADRDELRVCLAERLA